MAAYARSRPSNISASPSQATMLTTTREIVFGGSVPLCVRLGEREPFSGDRLVDAHYVQAPRISYLPLLMADLRRYFLDLVVDEATLATLQEDSLWFEIAGSNEPVRWHWPIGLLYDYHTVNTTFATLSATSTNSTFSNSMQTNDAIQPLHLILHLRDPPTDKLLIGPSIDACRTNFMNLVKEADFVRWGSTRRVTALRKVDQDALWDGVISRNFDAFWAVAAKLIPAPSLHTPSSTPVERSVSNQSAKSANSTSGAPSALDGRSPDSTAMRSVPVRIYLPDNIPVLQDVVPLIDSDGNSATLYSVLSAQVGLIFPPRSTSMSNSFVARKPAGKAIIQGVRVPLDADLLFLSSCTAGPDGWLHIVVQLDVKGVSNAQTRRNRFTSSQGLRTARQSVAAPLSSFKDDLLQDEQQTVDGVQPLLEDIENIITATPSALCNLPAKCSPKFSNISRSQQLDNSMGGAMLKLFALLSPTLSTVSAASGFICKDLSDAGGYPYCTYSQGKNAPSGENWPTMVFLPGSGARGEFSQQASNLAGYDGQGKLIAQYLSGTKSGPQQTAAEQFFTIVPIAPLSDRHYFPERIQKVLQDASAHNNIDKDKTNISGYSMGARGVWRNLVANPETWAAGAASAGAAEDTDAPTLTQQRAVATFPSLNRILDIPVRQFDGLLDTTAGFQSSRLTQAELVKLGGNVSTLTEMPGKDHSAMSTAPWMDTDLVSWFLKQARNYTQFAKSTNAAVSSSASISDASFSSTVSNRSRPLPSATNNMANAKNRGNGGYPTPASSTGAYQSSVSLRTISPNAVYPSLFGLLSLLMNLPPL